MGEEGGGKREDGRREEKGMDWEMEGERGRVMGGRGGWRIGQNRKGAEARGKEKGEEECK
jgi:hypothetical protein